MINTRSFVNGNRFLRLRRVSLNARKVICELEDIEGQILIIAGEIATIIL